MKKKTSALYFGKIKVGLIYGITYVDHKTKTVFNGSGLGKSYSAKAIQKKCLPETIMQPEIVTG